MRRVLCFIFLTIGCWLAMQAVHELGHAAAAWGTGGRVARVVLLPWTISRTDVEPNPHPLAVVWGGPIFGAAAPLLAWGLARWGRRTLAPLTRFFAGFCLVANGLYLGIGSFEGIGDAGDLLAHGAPRWTLWLFAAITVPAGFALWHRQGVSLGLTPGSPPPSRAFLGTVIGGTLATAALGLLLTRLSN